MTDATGPDGGREHRAPAPSPWPANAIFGDAGLTVGGLSAAELAERFGTPLLVLDEDDVRARCRAFRDAFGDVLFAVKALPARAVARIALEEGLGLLAATGGELEFCLAAGAPPDRVVMHGNNKSDAEIRRAVEAGIRLLVVDNVEELDRIEAAAAAAGRAQPVLVRVVPGVDPHTHAYVDTGGRDTKFGVPIEGGHALEALKRAVALPHVRLEGLHAHIGSLVLDPAPYLAAAEVVLDVAAEARRSLGLDLPVLDVGGGFGATYTDEEPTAPSRLAPRIRAAVEEGSRSRGLRSPHLVVEPGRALVANPVLTLYRVGPIKEVPGVREYAAVDGGMSDNIRPMLYGSRHAFALANRGGSGEPASYTVVGKHCESGDVLGRDVALPADLESGDLLAVAATGAYAYSMASNYNRLGRPALVAVREGRARLLLRREDDVDLDRVEAGDDALPAVSTPPGVVVRPARPSDARGFLDLFRAVAAEGRVIRTEEVRRSVREQRRLLAPSWSTDQAHLVAVADGRVVGQLVASRESHPVNRHVASLGMAVAAQWRGRGVGSSLMSLAFVWAEEVGIEKLGLSVYPENRAAIALYAKFGFVQEGRLAGHSKRSDGYQDEIVMGRWLPRAGR